MKLGPRKGPVLIYKDDPSRILDFKEQDKRRHEVDKAISMTSSKLPYDSVANQSKKAENKKGGEAEEIQTVV